MYRNVKYNLDAMVFVKVYLFHFFFGVVLTVHGCSLSCQPISNFNANKFGLHQYSASRCLVAALDAPFSASVDRSLSHKYGPTLG